MAMMNGLLFCEATSGRPHQVNSAHNDRGGALVDAPTAYQLSESRLSTQINYTRPSQMMRQRANHATVLVFEKAACDVGNTITGAPAWPNTDN